MKNVRLRTKYVHLRIQRRPVELDQSLGEMSKFYLWTTNTEAGISEDYEECKKNYTGKPGGRCIKKYSSEDEAQTELEKRLKELEKDSQTNESDPIDPLDNINQHPTKETTITEEERGGHDEHYEEFQLFMDNQKEFNKKIEQQVARNTIEIGEQLIELKDIENKSKNYTNEIKLTCEAKIEEAKIDISAEIKKLAKRISSISTKMSTEADSLKHNAESNENSLKEILEEICELKEQVSQSENRIQNQLQEIQQRNHTFEENNPQDPQLNQSIPSNQENNPQDTQYNQSIPPNQIVDPHEQTEPEQRHVSYSGIVTNNRYEVLENDSNPSNRETAFTNAGPILMLSDSMFRGIKQNKFAPQRRINKQYIAGGTREMADYIQNMEDHNNYEYIIIHSGINDVEHKDAREITTNIKECITIAQQKWPDATLAISGIMFVPRGGMKNRRIDEINSCTNRLCYGKTLFIDNRRVTCNVDGTINEEVFYDDVHLNNNIGTKKLVSNLKYNLGLRPKASGNTARPWNNRRNRVDTQQEYYRQEQNEYQRYITFLLSVGIYLTPSLILLLI